MTTSNGREHGGVRHSTKSKSEDEPLLKLPLAALFNVLYDTLSYIQPACPLCHFAKYLA